MFRLMVKPMLSLTALLTLAILLAQPGPYDDRQMTAFLTAPENCDGLCLLGILPGKTTVSEALAALQGHIWVSSIQTNASGNGYGQIRWEWSAQRPAVIDASYPGRITFYWDSENPNGPGLDDTIIDTVAVMTFVPMYPLQTWYGKPDSGMTTLRPDGDVGYSAAFHRQGRTVGLSTALGCPATLREYWDATAKITISRGYGTSTYVPPGYMVTLC